MDCCTIEVLAEGESPPSTLEERHAALAWDAAGSSGHGWVLWHATRTDVAGGRVDSYVIGGTHEDLDDALRSSREFLRAYYDVDDPT